MADQRLNNNPLSSRVEQVDKPSPTAASQAGRQVMKRYALTLLGLVLELALLAGVALFVQNRQLIENSK